MRSDEVSAEVLHRLFQHLLLRSPPTRHLSDVQLNRRPAKVHFCTQVTMLLS